MWGKFLIINYYVPEIVLGGKKTKITKVGFTEILI